MQDAEHWQELQTLFDLADTAAQEDRERVLTEAGSTPEMRQRVLALLEAAEQAPGAAPPRPPIGPYTILKLIGSGGMGSVYLAADTRSGGGQRVALKVLAPHAAGPGFVDRFARERRILATLENPGITRLLDAGLSTDGDPYMVMEYVEGLHLDDYCTANHLDLRARLHLFQRICGVVDYAHSSSVVHLDLKPSNILVTAEGDVKLLDFGTAKLVSSDGTLTATMMATPAYASPEQLRYEPVTLTSDVYSLGVILFEMLVGRRPARGAKPLTAAERVGSIRSVELSAMLAKCLAEAPGERYPVVKALADDVARFLEGRPILGRPQTAGGSISRIGRVFKTAILLEPKPPRFPSVEELSNDLDRYLRQPPEVARRQSSGSWIRIGGNAGGAMLAAALVLVCGLAYWNWRGRAAHSTASIAVLPFVNLSGDSADLYFSDGLTDEIADALGRFKNLRVTARASAFQFRSRTADIRDVGSQLGVANILEGSVGRSGDHVKVVARLKRVSDGSTIWSDTYDLTSAGLLAAQSELAAGIARNLNAATLHQGRPRHVPPPDAHDLYLRGVYESEQLTAASLKRAEADFERAIELDRSYAAAYAGMGAAVLNRRSARFRNQADGEVRRASELLQKALELDPDMATARSALASIAMTVDWDWARAERELQSASATGPNAAVESTYAVFMTYKGRFVEADDHLRRALDLDPLSVAQGMRAGAIRTWEGRYEEAIEYLQRITERYPKMIQPAIIGAAQQAAIGHADLALQTLDRMNPALPEVRIYKAMVLAHLGRTAEAYNFTVPFEKDFQNSDVPVEWLALVHAIAGDDENAVTWLERSAERRESQVLCIAVNPVFKRLRGKPRFGELTRRIGLEPVNALIRHY